MADSAVVEMSSMVVGPEQPAATAAVAAAAHSDEEAKYAPSEAGDSDGEDVEPIEIPRGSRVMSLMPSRKVLLEFTNVGLSVPIGKKFVHKHDSTVEQRSNGTHIKHILRDVTGYIRPGELVAVMGASGAGKSSLLNVLARRNCQNTGAVTVNGERFSKELQGLTAYVQQDDILMGNLTVREHLRFQARLRMDQSLSLEQKYDRVEQLISSLSLQKCAGQQIGAVTQNLTRGISGGERKRVAFASEIITDPALLFADEPTSGLDSFMAESVTRTLKALADNGRTVVCTIHQPSSEVYALFDRVIFLSEGRIAYFGSREGAIKHFKKLGYPCPMYSNPADYFINVLAVSPSDELDEAKRDAYFTAQKARVKAIEDAWATRYPSGKALAVDSRTQLLLNASLEKKKAHKASTLTQLAVLTTRAFLSDARDQILGRARLGQSLVLGVLLGLMYLQLDNNQASIQNKAGAIFFILINQSMSGTFGVLQTFPLERPVFQREYENGNYGLGQYYFSKVMAALPQQIIYPVIFMLIGYWLIGLNDNFGVFLAFTGVVLLTSNAAMSMGYAISSAVPNVSVALAIGPLVLLPFLLFGGFFLNTDSIPAYFVWLEHISFFKYGFSALMIIIWSDVDHIDCDTANAKRCINNGDEVLDLYAFDKSNLARDIWALIISVIAFRLLAFFALWLGTRLRKQNESGSGCCSCKRKSA